MKKTLALALTTVAACTAAHAQSSVTVYGLLDLTVGRSETGSGTTGLGGTGTRTVDQRIYRVDSGLGLGSRLGFRGVEDLGGGMRALFLLEMGIAVDTGAFNQGGLAFGRQAYVGLGGSNWTLTAGRQYTPINNSIAATEPVGGGMWGSVTSTAMGVLESIGSVAGSGTHQMSGRANNSIGLSVKTGDLTSNLMASTGDENSRGTGRSVNLGFTYAAGPLRADVSYLRLRQNVEAITATASPEWLTQWMLGGSYNLDVVKLYAGMYQFNAAKNKANYSPLATLGNAAANPQAYAWDKNKIYWIAAGIPFGASTVKLQAARQQFTYTGAPDGKATILTAVYQYDLSKRTMLYTSYGQVTNNNRARTPLYGAIPQVGPNGFGADPRALSAGIQHRF